MQLYYFDYFFASTYKKNIKIKWVLKYTSRHRDGVTYYQSTRHYNRADKHYGLFYKDGHLLHDRQRGIYCDDSGDRRAEHCFI